MYTLNTHIPAGRARRTGVAGALALVLGLAAGQINAKELEAGFIIDKSNDYSIKNDTFEKKTIASMVP